ncbi:hypothetical protein RND71_030729 [Anisodus tanguticus]|uniref:Peptidase A1 domain-containing protein n=1 Tax=Anisodus tanguticus TaxID=243964 RepID=A0AAE1V5R8_9SOLA|nr:hypothetical protein RND71_030729 [Anisodus tanguticus]
MSKHKDPSNGILNLNSQLNIGQRSRPFFLDPDTGSDLTWLQCDAPCVRCTRHRSILILLSWARLGFTAYISPLISKE